MRRAAKVLGWMLLVVIAAAGLLYAYAAFDGFVDSGAANSDDGRLELTLAIGSHPDSAGNIDAIGTRIDGHPRSADVRYRPSHVDSRRLMRRTLPAGSTLDVEVALRTRGPYTHGGGWMGLGHHHVGWHSVPASVLEARSEDSEVVAVALAPAATGRCAGPACSRIDLELVTRSPGRARIFLRAAAHEVAEEPERASDRAVTDTVTVTVE